MFFVGVHANVHACDVHVLQCVQYEINANTTAHMWGSGDQGTFSVVCANYKVIYFLLTVNSNLQTPV